MKYMLPLLVILSGCATPEYQRSGENGTHKLGYSEIKVTGDSYRITYIGSSQDNAYIGFMRRASELTLKDGYKYFVIKDVGPLKEAASANNILIRGTTYDFSIPQYQATMVMKKQKPEDGVDAEEFLKTNPIPRKK
jgi:hypothetical protein